MTTALTNVFLTATSTVDAVSSVSTVVTVLSPTGEELKLAELNALRTQPVSSPSLAILMLIAPPKLLLAPSLKTNVLSAFLILIVPKPLPPVPPPNKGVLNVPLMHTVAQGKLVNRAYSVPVVALPSASWLPACLPS